MCRYGYKSHLRLSYFLRLELTPEEYPYIMFMNVREPKLKLLSLIVLTKCTRHNLIEL